MDGVDACHAALASPDWEVVGQRGRVILYRGAPRHSEHARRCALRALSRALMYATDVAVVGDNDTAYLIPAYAVDNLIRHILDGD